MAEKRGRSLTVRCGVVAVAVVLVAMTAEARHPGTWDLATDMPKALSYHASVAIGDTVFVLGGVSDMMTQDRVYALDTGTGVWSERAPMPEARAAFGTAVVEGRIYVIGGVGQAPFLEQGSVMVYHPEADVWTFAADLPTARWGLGTAVLDGKIWVVGGSHGEVAAPEEVLSTVEILDPATGLWKADKASQELPVPRVGLAVVESGGRILAIGGLGADGSVTGRVDAYDPGLRAWTRQPSLVVPRAYHAAVALEGAVHVIGGFNEHGDRVDCVEREGPSWERIGRAPLPTYGLSAAAAGTSIYVFGGTKYSDMSSALVYRPGLYSYWADSAAHVAGANGSQWRTTVNAVNLGDAPAEVEVVFHGDGTQGRLDRVVETGTQEVLEDVVGQMGLAGVGALELRSTQPLATCGRTYTDQGEGTFGQSCDLRASDEGCGVRGTVWLTGLRQEQGVARTNLIITNTGLWRVAVAVRLFRGDGLEVGHFGLTVEPGQVVREIEPFLRRAGLQNVGCGFARVQVGDVAGVFVSASVIDAVTNDATTVYPKE